MVFLNLVKLKNIIKTVRLMSNFDQSYTKINSKAFYNLILL